MIRQALTLTLALILSAIVIAGVCATYLYIYRLGVEDGYWEYEAEENIYRCEVI